jgi:hypothetical protein
MKPSSGARREPTTKPKTREQLRTERPDLFAQMPHAILYADISHGAVRLYAVLDDHQIRSTARPSDLSQATLAGLLTGVNEGTVDRWAQELEALGMIKVERKPGQRNVYRLLPPPPPQMRVVGSEDHASKSGYTTLSNAGGSTQTTPSHAGAHKKNKKNKTGDDVVDDLEVASVAATCDQAGHDFSVDLGKTTRCARCGQKRTDELPDLEQAIGNALETFPGTTIVDCNERVSMGVEGVPADTDQRQLNPATARSPRVGNTRHDGGNPPRKLLGGTPGTDPDITQIRYTPQHRRKT